MKFMINGALTLGTLDGANVEIHEAVGNDNMFLFGMTTPEVQELKHRGYNPMEVWQQQPYSAPRWMRCRYGDRWKEIRKYRAVFDGNRSYMVLADFADYPKSNRRPANVTKIRTAGTVCP